VGYGRGARLIDFMAEDGVVGQYAGSQAREVLITMEQWAERSGAPALPPDPAPRRLKIQPHAAVAVQEDDQEEDLEEDDDEAADGEDAFADADDDDDEEGEIEGYDDEDSEYEDDEDEDSEEESDDD
jgi:S-DNA-T family DNA segregation ATPase FtsK/SpoIIIE